MAPCCTIGYFQCTRAHAHTHAHTIHETQEQGAVRCGSIDSHGDGECREEHPTGRPFAPCGQVIHACMHACMHAYMHACIHTFVRLESNKSLVSPILGHSRTMQDLYVRQVSPMKAIYVSKDLCMLQRPILNRRQCQMTLLSVTNRSS